MPKQNAMRSMAAPAVIWSLMVAGRMGPTPLEGNTFTIIAPRENRTSLNRTQFERAPAMASAAPAVASASLMMKAARSCGGRGV